MAIEAYFNANAFGRNRFAPAFDPEARLVMQRASTITPEKISWLSDGIIPIGKVTGIVGLPGRCKSLLTTDLAADRRRSRFDHFVGAPGGRPPKITSTKITNKNCKALSSSGLIPTV